MPLLGRVFFRGFVSTPGNCALYIFDTPQLSIPYHVSRLVKSQCDTVYVPPLILVFQFVCEWEVDWPLLQAHLDVLQARRKGGRCYKNDYSQQREASPGARLRHTVGWFKTLYSQGYNTRRGRKEHRR
jgi:hypothetical protein